MIRAWRAPTRPRWSPGAEEAWAPGWGAPPRAPRSWTRATSTRGRWCLWGRRSTRERDPRRESPGSTWRSLVKKGKTWKRIVKYSKNTPMKAWEGAWESFWKIKMKRQILLLLPEPTKQCLGLEFNWCNFSGERRGSPGGQTSPARRSYPVCPPWSPPVWQRTRRRLIYVSITSSVSVNTCTSLCIILMNARLYCVGWSVYVNHNHFFSNIWAFCPNPFFPVQLKIEEASRRLRSGDLGIPLNPEDRFE